MIAYPTCFRKMRSRAFPPFAYSPASSLDLPCVEWMNQTDDQVLELLDESDLILLPAVVVMNLDYTRNWGSRRMSKLNDAGVIEEVERGYYRISSKGRAYLTGEIDAVELENSE
ncbi:phage PhiH1 repressor protein [Haloferax mediterranei ATCC 33500]|uniref:Phage PhiH1 repressor protein n=3 Tax=Haloferacaceae TaxID=1644056 RepID=M0J837_HALMT|nr:phage PhiH1 repressor protein [Haloferax mediterranei ATCC 33500]